MNGTGHAGSSSHRPLGFGSRAAFVRHGSAALSLTCWCGWSPNPWDSARRGGFLAGMICAARHGTGAAPSLARPCRAADRSGRSPDWLKMKNANAPAVKTGGGGGMGQRKAALRQSFRGWAGDQFWKVRRGLPRWGVGLRYRWRGGQRKKAPAYWGTELEVDPWGTWSLRPHPASVNLVPESLASPGSQAWPRCRPCPR